MACLFLYWESGLKYTVHGKIRTLLGLFLYWESGLKYSFFYIMPTIKRLFLYWESGLKYHYSVYRNNTSLSLPVLGEWIEMNILWRDLFTGKSLPVLGEWIEISQSLVMSRTLLVSSCIGRVDWNSPGHLFRCVSCIVSSCIGRGEWNGKAPVLPTLLQSLSLYWESGLKYRRGRGEIQQHSRSLPVLGEWIEILLYLLNFLVHWVSPCIGRVDWNPDMRYLFVPELRLSLYWESGLK